VYVASTNKALIYALQAEEGLSTSAANGAFGPTTTADCPTLNAGDTRTSYVKVLQYALYCNGFDPGGFDGTYGSGVTNAVKAFQSSMCLSSTGIADMPTIKASMASCGDTNRSASACDCETIYFAVDFDAMDSDVTSNVLPYFQAIKSYFDNHNGNGYKIGIYGARNICSRVCSAGYASNVFVGDMSTGFSGNLGYKMPAGWSYDQFTTVTIGSGSGQIEIDKDSFSNNDAGVSAVNNSYNTPQVYKEVPVTPSETKVADPVDSSTGSHVIQKSLLELQGALKFSFDLNYNSSQLSIGAMGKGWYDNYEMRIEKQPDGSLYYYSSPSSYIAYTQSSTAGLYTTSTIGKKNWNITANSDGTYLLNCANNMDYYFDKNGNLTKIQNKIGMVLNITYPSTTTMVITEPISGKSITVNYSNGFVSTVADSANRTVNFQYDSNMCISAITDENGNTEKYTYDSAGHVLTGISGDNKQYFTDVYDSTGRIISQDDGVAGNKLTLFGYDTTSVSNETIVTVTDRNGNSYKNTFNNSNQLISSTDQDGNAKQYTYDADGNILTETDANGHITTKTYDSNDNLLTSTDPVSSKTVYTYDSNNNMLSQINPDGGTIQYTYDSSNRITSMTDARGIVTNYVYDNNGLVTEKDVSNRKYTYTYQNGILATSTDPQSGSTTYTYNAVGNVATTTDAKGNETTNTYDKKGNILSKTDPNGGVVSYTYDSCNNLLTQKDANGNTTSYTYNANNKLTSMTDAKGAVTTYTYDGEDRETSVKHANGGTDLTSYDATGRITSKTDANSNVTKYTYDAAGNVLTTTNPSGGVTTDTYNANNKLKTETDASGNIRTYQYDSGWRLSSVTDSLGKSKTYAYDLQGNLLSETDKMGNVTTYTYDAYGNMLTKKDPNGNVTTYTYDGNNKRTSLTDALGNKTTYTYDLSGLLQSTEDALGNETTYTYDADGRLTGQTDALGDTCSILYDANGNTVKKTDGNGKSESFTFDADNLQLSAADALGEKVSNSYDAEGNLTQTIDAMGNKTTYKYDAGGRLTAVTDANNGVSVCQYTATGNIALLTGAAGGATNYTYDAAGRITSFTDAEGTTSYTYDKNGNVLTVSDAQGTITRQYDALNRVIKYTDVNKNVVQYTYDAVGNLATIIYPNGKIVTYSYDAGNRLIKVSDWSSNVTNYAYDKNNNLITTQRPDGSVLTETYDDAERLIGMKDVDKAGNIINSYAYTYSANGQVTKEVSSNGQVTSTMTYDVLNRLLSRNDTDNTGKVTASYTYTYDLAGNVTSGSDKVSYDQNNRLTAYNGINLAYDADGNMTTGVVGGVSSSLTYDSGNRLVQAGGITYTYDALDNRISETVSGKMTTFVYDDSSSDLSRLLVSTDSNGQSTYYIYGIGLLGEQGSSGNYLMYHYDLRGSTTAITNKQNTVTDRYTYGSYGELLSHTGTSTTPFLYNGRDGVMTDSNGLNYMRARYYSPTLKRFINADTLKGSIKDGETLNNYAYANGNPISMVDPFGRCADLASDGMHTALDGAGMIPLFGAIPDGINAIWYAKDGEWGNAGLSLVNAIPFVGDITDSLKIGKDTVEVGKDLETVDKIVEDANVVSEGAAEAEQGVWEMSEGGATINGRNYSQHALERMAPDTPQVRAELERRAADIAQGKGLEPGTKAYSDFVNKYVDPRNIPPSVIEDAINNTNATPGKYADTFVHETGDVTVVVNGAGNVITVIPK
jgi:RHS repeat-associated protein